MKNILIITPFYPFPEKTRLKKDSNAVYYLAKNNLEDENTVILFYYQHTRLNAIKNIWRIITTTNYKKCLYSDDLGHDVLLFEHPCLIPHSFRTFRFIDKRYAKFIRNYAKDRKIEFDTVIVHFPVRFTPLAKLINSKRHIAILHSFDVEKEERLELTKVYSNSYTAVGYRSEQIRKVFLESNTSDSGYLCLSGVPDNYLEQYPKDKPWKKDGILRIAFVGKLVPNKNVKSVVTALNHLKEQIDFKLTIIGDGEEFEEISSMVRSYDLNGKVLMTGAISRDEVFQLLRENDVFILTSFKETLGLVYLEAMAAGNLIIGSRDRGVHGIAKDHQEGIFVDPKSIEEIKKAIVEYYNMDLSQVLEMKKKSYDLIEKMSESNLSREYYNFALNDGHDGL